MVKSSQVYTPHDPLFFATGVLVRSTMSFFTACFQVEWIVMVHFLFATGVFARSTNKFLHRKFSGVSWSCWCRRWCNHKSTGSLPFECGELRGFDGDLWTKVEMERDLYM